MQCPEGAYASGETTLSNNPYRFSLAGVASGPTRLCSNAAERSITCVGPMLEERLEPCVDLGRSLAHGSDIGQAIQQIGVGGICVPGHHPGFISPKVQGELAGRILRRRERGPRRAATPVRWTAADQMGLRDDRHGDEGGGAAHLAVTKSLAAPLVNAM